MSDEIAQAARWLQAGRVVAFPTETVYGLGADAHNPLAVRQVFALKGRPTDHPLIVHIHSAQQMSLWAQPTAVAQALAARFWPGPLTLILPRTAHTPDEVTGGQSTVGLRVPAHPTARQLLAAFGGGLAAPSANRFGRISPTTAQHVRDEFGDSVAVLDGGACAVGVESTIVDLSGAQPALLRPGGLPLEEIEAITGPLQGTSTVRAPGTLASHYAPHTALVVTAHIDAEVQRLQGQGLRVAVLRAAADDVYARQLYAELRRLDQQGVDVLIAEPAQGDGGLAMAINDRLARASTPPAIDPKNPA